MKLPLRGLLIVLLTALPLYGQNKYWELKQGELRKMVESSDIVVDGKISKKLGAKRYRLRVEEVFQGPARLRSLKISISPKKIQSININSPHIFFLRNSNKNFTLLPVKKNILKSDIFLASRVRTEAIMWRIKRSQIVVMASVEAIQETKVSGKLINVTAQCKLQRVFKGSIPQTFTIHYQRISGVYPPMVLLFKRLSYIFFLKSGTQQKYPLLTSYEGAYLERRSIIEGVKRATKLENRFDGLAGKPVKGLVAFAEISQGTASKTNPIFIKVLLHNRSKKSVEIYHNHISYFTLFHILDDSGKSVKTKYPRKNSVPPVHERYFIKLTPNEYIIMPDFNLQDYCQLKPGKYSIYIEFHLPWEYAGNTLGKVAWSGKVISNKMELEITE